MLNGLVRLERNPARATSYYTNAVRTEKSQKCKVQLERILLERNIAVFFYIFQGVTQVITLRSSTPLISEGFLI